MHLTTKLCASCGIEKALDDFYMRKYRDRSAPRSDCKTCWNAKSLQHQRANPERYREYGRRTRAKVSRRARSLREKFKMTIEQWEAELDGQGGVCAICRGPAQALRSGGVEGEPQFHTDHNHRTGEFRGILCGLCNRMLGQALDNPERLLAGARYLQERGY